MSVAQQSILGARAARAKFDLKTLDLVERRPFLDFCKKGHAFLTLLPVCNGSNASLKGMRVSKSDIARLIVDTKFRAPSPHFAAGWLFSPVVGCK
jgi:hypothetical protein